ncbi:MAG: helix-turn-helix domain-containing protein [Chloroflexi bacterium]|nr:MAG: helix-turn-helix domain-containing protein [Chloroflexota bacterium]TME14251.1 MAG: helix-turn-helix domain-containing protein [Chloroflexota bacterium]TME18671.1 MAG: helix-turn-helix domain-containing protein [Chloroflexota bacterium]
MGVAIRSLIPGEDPATGYPADARRWVTVYEELSTINSGFLDRAREQGAPIDEINRLEAEVTRVGERLRFWHARHWELVGVELDVNAGILGHNGRAVALTPREAQLFGFLLAHPNRFFATTTLPSRAWGNPNLAQEQVRTYVGRLRGRLEAAQVPCRLVSQPRQGYALVFD